MSEVQITSEEVGGSPERQMALLPMTVTSHFDVIKTKHGVSIISRNLRTVGECPPVVPISDANILLSDLVTLSDLMTSSDGLLSQSFTFPLLFVL